MANFLSNVAASDFSFPVGGALLQGPGTVVLAASIAVEVCSASRSMLRYLKFPRVVSLSGPHLQC